MRFLMKITFRRSWRNAAAIYRELDPTRPKKISTCFSAWKVPLRRHRSHVSHWPFQKSNTEPLVGAANREVEPEVVANGRLRKGQNIMNAPRRSEKSWHFNARVWTAEEDALLGTMSDAKVAEQVGVCSAAATQRRNKLGIPPFSHQGVEYRWHPEDEALLGEMTDKELAARLGIADSTVRKRRHELGIPHARKLVWTAHDEALLGTMTDKSVADQLGFAVATVKKRRHELGIKSFAAPAPPSHAWTKTEEKLLGTMPDSAVARKVGVEENVVWRHRTALSIAPFHVGPRPVNWTRAKLERLGKEPDAVLAKRWKMSSHTIQLKRFELVQVIPPGRSKNSTDRLILENLACLNRERVRFQPISAFDQ